jgi:diguanylate cyclase (GGDEF)-like protein/PAS domain S-box-containing protein
MHAELSAVEKGLATTGVRLRILLVHRHEAHVDRCLEEFDVACFRIGPDSSKARASFIKELDSNSYDVIVAEYPTFDGQGSGLLEILRRRKSQIPLIFVTSSTEAERVAELITQGAADCVEGEHLGRLPIAIRRALRESNLRQSRDRTEKKLRNSEAHYRALVGNLSYGICRCSESGSFLDVNQALMAMLGYPSRRDLMATHLARKILGDPEMRAQLLGGCREVDRGRPLEVDWARKDGSPLRVRLGGREVRNKDEPRSYEIIVEDVTQQRKLEDYLRLQATKDPLTGLANYRQLVEVLDTEINRSERTAREFSVLFLDLDGLKNINDRFGHLVGSQALCRLADVLGNSCRNIDTTARFGGDEFAIILPETGRAPAKLVARRICDNLKRDGKKPRLSVSVGAAVYPDDGKTIEGLLGAADTALYSMKAELRTSHVKVHRRSFAATITGSLKTTNV